MAYDDLVFNPEAYARVIAKQDAEGHKGRGNHYFKAGKKAVPQTYGGYYDPSKGFGKLWEGVNDWHKSHEWE